jgi:DNA-binding response OmpR family regulator
MLPDGNGLDFLAELRGVCAAPVLFLTAKTEKEDKLAGLRAGGNDYITKPYDIDELRERVSAFLRLIRDKGKPPDRIAFGSLTFDLISNQAFADGRDILLTQKEFALLLFLAQRKGEVFSAEHLYEKVWNASAAGDSRAVKYQLSNLRKKLAGSGYTVVAERGEGYRFETE